jgi:hypothetical protein
LSCVSSPFTKNEKRTLHYIVYRQALEIKRINRCRYNFLCLFNAIISQVGKTILSRNYNVDPPNLSTKLVILAEARNNNVLTIVHKLFGNVMIEQLIWNNFSDMYKILSICDNYIAKTLVQTNLLLILH